MEKQIALIDMPGMGDTQGIIKDQNNIAKLKDKI